MRVVHVVHAPDAQHARALLLLLLTLLLCVHSSVLQGKPIVGWSEYIEERNIGVTQVIEWMGELVTGLDP
jgi:hypothetical protein